MISLYEYADHLCKLVLLTGAITPGLSAERHAGGPPAHHGASVGPGRAPWRVLWAFEVEKSGKQPRDRFPTSHRQSGSWKTHELLCRGGKDAAVT